MRDFVSWMRTFVSEKDLDLDHRFEMDGPSGMVNSIPLSNVVAATFQTCQSEQDVIRKHLISLDFRNSDVLEYFQKLAAALAI
jgi:hypothetical protein